FREAEFARPLSHRNIVRTIGICTAVPYIVSEYMANGSLKSYLMKKKASQKPLSKLEYLPIAQKIACAMAHLEKLGIVHRDLAARNVLVGVDHNCIKLADFGLARRVLDSGYYKASKGLFAYKWTAPEAWSAEAAQRGKFTSASDVWSFAVVLWELYSDG
ncbi:hypothetical protein PFISCL1PPCAC_568, partial [Pristionchus fissidentatus]